MDNWNNDITMMKRKDLETFCCAPIFGYFNRIAWLRTERPLFKSFMTGGNNKDQNYSERELCSSSLSDIHSQVPRDSDCVKTIKKPLSF